MDEQTYYLFCNDTGRWGAFLLDITIWNGRGRFLLRSSLVNSKMRMPPKLCPLEKEIITRKNKYDHSIQWDRKENHHIWRIISLDMYSPKKANGPFFMVSTNTLSFRRTSTYSLMLEIKGSVNLIGRGK